MLGLVFELGHLSKKIISTISFSGSRVSKKTEEMNIVFEIFKGLHVHLIVYPDSSTLVM